MSVETIVIWIAIGLAAGWLASLVVGGGYGVVGDIVLGIVGAFLGGLGFRALHLGTPFRGVASTIFVAFVGSFACWGSNSVGQGTPPSGSLSMLPTSDLLDVCGLGQHLRGRLGHMFEWRLWILRRRWQSLLLRQSLHGTQHSVPGGDHTRRTVQLRGLWRSRSTLLRGHRHVRGDVRAWQHLPDAGR